MGHRTACCSCGQLRVTVTGDPVRISVCHCQACQRRTGSAFGVQARFPVAAVAISGPATAYVRLSEDGNRVTLHFCPRCGATVHYRLEGLEDFVGIPVGAFADPGFPPPGVSVYEEHKHPWVGLPADIEHEY